MGVGISPPVVSKLGWRLKLGTCLVVKKIEGALTSPAPLIGLGHELSEKKWACDHHIGQSMELLYKPHLCQNCAGSAVG